MLPNDVNPEPAKTFSFARQSLPLASRLLRLCALPVLLSGCAVHYGDTAKGIQHAWGIGRTTWETRMLANELTAISSGFRLPGLVVGIGPDFVGINLGYHVRERLQIIPEEETADCGATLNGHALARDEGHRWGLGHFRTRTPNDSGIAVVQGRAEAGLTLATERGLPLAAAGWQSQMITSVTGRDVFVELQSTTRTWPYFDFPKAEVSAGIADQEADNTARP